MPANSDSDIRQVIDLVDLVAEKHDAAPEDVVLETLSRVRKRQANQ